MDTATCYTLIALLAGACGALMFLWYRAASRQVGEYCVVTQPVELPPTGALADDLYAAHRGARMMVDKSTCPPLMLAGCDDGQRAGWRAVARRVEDIVCPPKREAIWMADGRGTLTTSILALFALGLVACTPMQRQAAQQRAAAGALDFGMCAAQEVAPGLVRGIAEVIEGSPSWRSDLLGVTAPAVSCALLALVRQLSQAGEVSAAARAARLDPAAQVQQLAQRCERGPCTDIRERAAWLLAKGAAR